MKRTEIVIASVCVLLIAGLACPVAGVSEELDAVVGSVEALPRLSVKEWYLEIDDKPTYLVGYSPGMFDEKQHFGKPTLGRLTKVPEGVNYMRTWLEWQREEKYSCPFVQIEGKADLSRIDPVWLQNLRTFLDASAKAGVVQELTLFNPWYARDDWETHYWNPDNNVQGLAVDPHSLYTLDNPCQPYQEQWVEAILDVVDASLARQFTIIEIDNELKTGGGAWREHFVKLVKARGDYIVSTIATYCGDYDAIGGPNDILCLHSGGSGNPTQYHKWTVNLPRAKPVIFNELYVWWRHARETQRAVFWNAFLSGSMLCAYQWDDDGKTSSEFTEKDLSVLAKFANSIPFHRFRPGDDWLISVPAQSCGALREDGNGFLAYLWGGGDGKVQVSLPGAEYMVSWIDPATGALLREPQELKASGTIDLAPPPYDLDITCYIERIRP